MPSRTLVVTAASESFMPLLRGLVGSLNESTHPSWTDIACFDLGLESESVAWVGKHVRYISRPGWDLPVDSALRLEQPHLRALTVRPFLPRYFPGYDIYLWIDTDAWVQQLQAIDWFIEAAQEGAMAVVPQVHPAYRQTREGLEWRMGRLRSYFGQDYAQHALWEPYFNAGVFALPANAPHWQAWARRFHEGLVATAGKHCCDQTALNHALWHDRLPVTPLPATCNWLCHLAEPVFDPSSQLLCEPMRPGQPIGIVHLSADSKDARIALPYPYAGQSMDLRFHGPAEQRYSAASNARRSEPDH